MSLAFILSTVLLAIYVLIGAVDLGIGLLLRLATRGSERDAILAGGGQPWSAGAVWTILAFALVVTGLPGSLAALRALWLPLALMLLSLVLRGALSSVRPHVLRRDLVDLVFGLASAAAAGCQGLILGWAVAGLGTSVPARHAGAFGAASVWGLLCAAGVFGLYALLGAGWLILSGRDAVRVFGREVGRAAAILLAVALALCTLWAVWPTDVAARALARGWASWTLSGCLAATSLVLLVPFVLALWGQRPALPLICAALSTMCGLAAVAALLSTVSPSAGASGEGSSSAYLAFVLMLGSPLPLLGLLRRRNDATRGAPASIPRQDAMSHAGRRSGSLANSLHLS